MDSPLSEPVFIVGAGRSGSTAFFDLLTHASNAVWLTSWKRRRESRMIPRPVFYSLIDRPMLGPLLRRRYPPTEGYDFWNSLFPGFGTPYRDLVAGDVSERTRSRIRRAVAAMPVGRRSQCLFKITGWPRIGFLDAIFPRARYIHVVRDGRAVANSLMGVPWWRGWQGPAQWRWGPLSAEYAAAWDRHGNSFVALAAIQWAILMDAMIAARRELGPDRFMEIRYEDLCDRPAEIFARTCDFAGLEGQERIVPLGARLRAQNDKWQRDLTPEQQQSLSALLTRHLAQFGYD